MIRALHVALSFLTTLPLPAIRNWQEDDARRAVLAYPLVGLILGGLLYAGALLLTPLPDALRGALLLGLSLLLTGALHFDGFCDMADAAFAAKPPGVRQEIAKDPHLGAFALAAGGVLLLVKSAALGTLAHPALLLVVPLLSRTAVLLPLALYEVHGSSHLGATTQPSRLEVLAPLLLGLGLSIILTLLLSPPTVLSTLLIGAFGPSLLLAHWLNIRLGGLSGDAYGACIETSEAALLILAATL